MNKKRNDLAGFPNPPTATVTLCSSYRRQHIGLVFHAKQSEESKYQGFFIVNDLFFGDDRFMLGACLQSLDEEFVPCATTSA